MSYFVFFDFSVSVKRVMQVPKGTVQSIRDHIAETESKLKLKREKYRKNPEQWSHVDRFKEVDDDTLCSVVSKHNRFIVWLYERLEEWSQKRVKDGESFTVAESKKLFPFLTKLSVKPERWTRDYYREQMERCYIVMRGHETDGVSLNAKTPLTEKQADAVITLFSEYLDKHDIRLAVPIGHDYLKASYDGGYDWCEKHGAIDENDFHQHLRACATFREKYPEEVSK